MAKKHELGGSLYTIAPAAHAAGCSESTIKRYVRDGVVKPATTVTGLAIFTDKNIQEIRAKLGR